MPEEERHHFLPEQEYKEMSTYDFIYFIQDYSSFLRQYINNKYRDDQDEVGYLTSFIDICERINTDYGDDNTFEEYRATLEPLIKFMTQSCEDMNVYHEENLRNEQLADAKTGIAHRTRSKQPVTTDFEIAPSKRGTNIITLGPIKKEAVRIKLSDGKQYTYDEIKDMWRFSQVETPYRHPYTEEDKQKITHLIEFATKGGKRKRRTKKNKKSRKSRRRKKTRRK